MSELAGRNFTRAATVRRRSDNWPFTKRTRAVERSVKMVYPPMRNRAKPGLAI